MTEFDASHGLPAAFRDVGSPSFVELLKGHAPELLPINRADRADREAQAGRQAQASGQARAGGAAADSLDVRHGTTVLALTFADGVMMAGDRRATSGNVIAQRDLEKVQPADQYSIIAFAGAVGPAADMVRLFQVELEHYEKINGTPLSLDGKARRLATVLRANFPLAMQGLAVVPLFAGYDLTADTGRVFSFEVVGGPYEERDFYAEGSGSPYARGALKKLYRPGLSVQQAAQVCVEALYDAADDDSATGGPDVTRGIYPVIATATADGYRRLPDDEVRDVTQAMIEARRDRPDGPAAPLR